MPVDTEPADDIRRLADEIYRERVLRARRTPPEQKLMLGAILFDYACGITVSGIRAQFPEADDAEVHRILCERLALARKLEQRR